MALDAGTGHAADARMAQALFERGEYHKSSDILRNFSKTSVRDSLPPLRHNALVAEYLAAREGFPEDEKIKSSSAVSPSPDPWAVIDALGKLRETGEGDMSFESLSVLKYNQAALYLEVRCYDVAGRLLRSLFDSRSKLPVQLATRASFALVKLEIYQTRLANVDEVISYLSHPNTITALYGEASIESAAAKNKTDYGNRNTDGRDLRWSRIPAHVYYHDLCICRARVKLYKREMREVDKDVKAALAFTSVQALDEKNIAFAASIIRERRRKLLAPLLLFAKIALANGNHAQALAQLLHSHEILSLTLPTPHEEKQKKSPPPSTPLAGSIKDEAPYLAILNNNIGCVLHKMGKPGFAGVFFRHALCCLNDPHPPSTSAQKRKQRESTAPMVAYNLGLACFLSGQYKAAVGALKAAARSPKMAGEPVSMARYSPSEGGDPTYNWFTVRSELAASMQGSTRSKRLPLASHCLKTGIALLYKQNDISTLETPNPTSPKATSTLDRTTTSPNPNQTDGKGSTKSAYVASSSNSPAEPHTIIELYILLMYTKLRERDPYMVLKYGKKLMKLRVFETCPPAHRHVFHTYMAEALCMTAKPTEACKFLNSPSLQSDAALNIPPPNYTFRNSFKRKRLSAVGSRGESDADKKKWIAWNKAALFVNLASCFVLRNNLAQALQVVKRAELIYPSFPPALRLLVYIYLRSGVKESALRLLKEDRSARMGIPFTRGSANSNVNSNSSKDSHYAHIGR
ncbi:hypothetical protein AAMO2058_000384700 [Amorphochlora amoebiformis]